VGRRRGGEYIHFTKDDAIPEVSALIPQGTRGGLSMSTEATCMPDVERTGAASEVGRKLRVEFVIVTEKKLAKCADWQYKMA
jgi:hypothetical protein